MYTIYIRIGFHKLLLLSIPGFLSTFKNPASITAIVIPLPLKPAECNLSPSRWDICHKAAPYGDDMSSSFLIGTVVSTKKSPPTAVFSHTSSISRTKGNSRRVYNRLLSDTETTTVFSHFDRVITGNPAIFSCSTYRRLTGKSVESIGIPYLALLAKALDERILSGFSKEKAVSFLSVSQTRNLYCS